MAVTCVQTFNGQVQVEILIPSPVPGWTDQQLLDWKGDAHAAHGWVVDWAQNRRSFDATKNYPVGGVVQSKRRLFRRAG